MLQDWRARPIATPCEAGYNDQAQTAIPATTGAHSWWPAPARFRLQYGSPLGARMTLSIFTADKRFANSMTAPLLKRVLRACPTQGLARHKVCPKPHRLTCYLPQTTSSSRKRGSMLRGSRVIATSVSIPAEILLPIQKRARVRQHSRSRTRLHLVRNAPIERRVAVLK